VIWFVAALAGFAIGLGLGLWIGWALGWHEALRLMGR